MPAEQQGPGHRHGQGACDFFLGMRHAHSGFTIYHLSKAVKITVSARWDLKLWGAEDFLASPNGDSGVRAGLCTHAGQL